MKKDYFQKIKELVNWKIRVIRNFSIPKFGQL